MRLTGIVPALRRDARGLAMVEFALALPLVLLTSCYGIEVANFALTNLRVSQVALALADNASRVGVSSATTQQLREVDLSDVLRATQKQGEQLNIAKYGRVTLSSLEADDKDVQRIHWQRCLGLKQGDDWKSHYGETPTSAGSAAGTAYQGTTVTGGMGPGTNKVKAPTGSGVMFVEVNYLYQPVFGTWLSGDRRIHYIASYIVRDRRDFTKIWNPDPQIADANRMTCNRYTDTVTGI